MLVDRRILHIARDKMDEAVTILTQELARVSWQRPARIYRPAVAAFDQIMVEVEFENWEEMEGFWAGWNGAPETAEFWKMWAEVARPGGSRELWETTE